MKRINPRSMTDKEVAVARCYKGVVRIVGNRTFEKYQFEKTDGSGTRFVYRAWIGKAVKPYHHYSYQHIEARDGELNKQITYAREEIIQEREAKAKEAELRKQIIDGHQPFPVGTVFVNMWGYDQTNVDYYEVVEAKGFRVVLRPIARNANETGWLQGDCQPIRGHYVGDKRISKTVLVNQYGFGISSKYGAMSVWDGKPDHWTAYA